MGGTRSRPERPPELLQLLELLNSSIDSGVIFGFLEPGWNP